MSTIIRTIKIPLESVYTQNADIGLYTSGGVSELRYTESPLTGVSTTYKEGLIIDIGAISHKADFRNGGAQVQVSDVEIILANAVNNAQFVYLLKFAGINLVGLTVEIEEHVGTESDSDVTEVVNLFTGSIENITWNELEYKITAKSSLALRRNNYLCKKSGDVVIPTTFGESNPARDIYFKALRLKNTNNILTLNDLKQGGTIYPEQMDLFPILNAGASPTLSYLVQLGQMDSTAYPDGSAFEDKYILIHSGKGGAGVYRKIHNCTKVVVDGVTNAVLQFDLYDYLSEDMVGNSSGTHETGGTSDQTWIQFVDIEMEYAVDDFACFGFCDSNGSKLVSAAELYGKSSDEIIRIPQYGYDVDVDNTDNNSLIIDAKLFNNSPYKMLSFVMSPCQMELYDADDLTLWSDSSETGWEKYVHTYDGIYRNTDYANFTGLNYNTFSNESNIRDKNSTTYAQHSFSASVGGSNVMVAKAYKIIRPDPPENFTFSNAYLSMKYLSKSESVNSTAEFRFKRRGYIDRLNHLKYIQTDDRFAGGVGGSLIDNTPDFYWVPNTSTNNKNFYVESTDVAYLEEDLIIGRKLLSLATTDKRDYTSIEELIIFTKYILYGGSTPDPVITTKIYQMSVIFEAEADVREVIYV